MKILTTRIWHFDISKAILRRKFIPISSYIKKIVTSQINNLMMYLKL
jgi:hypothetical protein